MKFGISSRPNGDFCANCNKPLNLDNRKENFCSYCGVPLNEKALDIREKEYFTVKLDTIDEIAHRITRESLDEILKDMKTEL